jgi:hypothetical protein
MNKLQNLLKGLKNIFGFGVAIKPNLYLNIIYLLLALPREYSISYTL